VTDFQENSTKHIEINENQNAPRNVQSGDRSETNNRTPIAGARDASVVEMRGRGGSPLNPNARKFLAGAGDEKSRMFRTKIASMYMGVSDWTIRQLVLGGILPVVQITEGAPDLLDKRDIDEFLDRRKGKRR
jgi:hypothetical protein